MDTSSLYLPLIQLLATLFSILYIIFAINDNRICFLFGIIGCSLWAYEDFFNINLFFDGFLQLFYIGMSVYGWIIWTRRDSSNEEQAIRSLSAIQQVLTIFSGLVVTILMAWIGMQFFNTKLPYLDSITTGFAIIATYLLAQKYIDNWIYWMIINPMYIYIYYKMNAWIFVGMMVIYTIMAVKGYWKWNSIRSSEVVS